MTRRQPAGQRSDHAADMTDDQFEDRLDDPGLILTHEEANSMIHEVMGNIAGIDTQLVVYQSECEVSGPDAVSDVRHAWFRKAVYARAMRKLELLRLNRRYSELRGLPGASASAQAARRQDRRDQQVRLTAAALAKAEASRAAQALQVRLTRDIADRKSFKSFFMRAARAGLTEHLFDSLLREAKRLRDEHMAIERGDA